MASPQGTHGRFVEVDDMSMDLKKDRVGGVQSPKESSWRPDGSPTFLSVRELAEGTGCSEDSIRRAQWNGHLAVERCGRRVLIRAAEFERWLAAGGLTSVAC